MNSLLFVIALFLQRGQAQDTEYVSDVPATLQSIFSVAGTECSTDTDCNDLTDASNVSGSFLCANGTSPNVCIYVECETDSDCASNEVCSTINLCNADGAFYPTDDLLYSTVCTASTLCDDIKVSGTWTDDTMCYIGEDEATYYSAEEAVICGQDGTGTCVASQDSCIDIANAAADCIEEKTCCGPDGWDQSGCIDLLFSEFLYYSIGAIALIVLCCCGCICLIVKCCRKRKEEDADDFEAQTNPYNVYV